MRRHARRMKMQALDTDIIYGPVGGLFEDITSGVTNAGRDILNTGVDAVSDSAGKGGSAVSNELAKIIESSEFGKFIEDKAREGVVKEVKGNAISLMILAAAAGAAGGAIASKTKIGMTVLLGAAVVAIMSMMQGSDPQKTKKK